VLGISEDVGDGRATFGSSIIGSGSGEEGMEVVAVEESVTAGLDEFVSVDDGGVVIVVGEVAASLIASTGGVVVV
jgi:hypothetical protein